MPFVGRWVLTLLLLATSSVPAQDAVPAPSAATGERLFAGAVALENGGPPCAACHSVAGLGFPNGGTMGPDLTRTALRFGDAGMDAALQTLFFPAMMPIFNSRPLTAAEQGDLKAFFQLVQSSPPPKGTTVELAGLAGVVFIVLLALSGVMWHGRIRGVRRPLLAQAARAGKRS